MFLKNKDLTGVFGISPKKYKREFSAGQNSLK
jgi:hypothetical protein